MKFSDTHAVFNLNPSQARLINQLIGTKLKRVKKAKKKRKMQVTKCDRCGRILTNAKGERVASANFDSGIEHRHPFNPRSGVIWALCDRCYEKAKQQETKKGQK